MEELRKIFTKLQFIDVATCDLNNNPNAAPKYLLKVKNNRIYLVDYVMTKTWNNVKINPRVSLAILHEHSLTGYQINGSAETIEEGKAYESLIKELSSKTIASSAIRVIKGVQEEIPRNGFEVDFPEKVGIIVVTIKGIIRIRPTGKLSQTKSRTVGKLNGTMGKVKRNLNQHKAGLKARRNFTENLKRKSLSNRPSF